MLHFDPPPGYRYFLHCDVPDGPRVSWNFDSISPGSDTDLGIVDLPQPGSVSGRIVDENGDVIRVSVYVRAETGREYDGHGPTMRGGTVKSDPTTGEYVLLGLPPGPITLTVDTQNSVLDRQPERSCTIFAGETTEFDLVVVGPRPETRVRAAVRERRMRWAVGPGASSVRLIDRMGAPVTPTEIADSGRLWTYDDVGPGPYTLVVDDPRFEPAKLEDVLPGVRTNLRLTGSAHVELVLVDASTGARIGSPAILAGPAESHSMRTLRDRIGVEHDEESGITRFDTVPDPQVWVISVDGYRDEERTFADGFAPRSVTELEIPLERSSTISGAVLDADGRPVSGWLVGAREERAEPESPVVPVDGVVIGRGVLDSLVATATTSPDGSFTLEKLAPGDYDIAVIGPPYLTCAALGVASGTRDVVLRLPPTGTIEGRITPMFDGIERCIVRLLPPERCVFTPFGVVPWSIGLMQIDDDAVAAKDGTFRIENVPAGPRRLGVSIPRVEVPMPNSGTSSSGGAALDPVDCFVEPGETTEVVVDAGASAPATVRITVRVDGRPAVGLLGFGVQEYESNGNEFIQACALTDSNGVASPVPVVPGRWRFGVRPLDCLWTVAQEEEHVLEAGDVLELEIDVTTTTKRIFFVDAGGAPLASNSVAFPRFNSTCYRRVDADGSIEVALPIGRHTAMMGSPHDGSELTAEFDWLDDGTDELRVVLLPGQIGK
ncbi:MAG: carboxypeptidase-like regulatory domain-containing protein [Planctomycetota bacterium]